MLSGQIAVIQNDPHGMVASGPHPAAVELNCSGEGIGVSTIITANLETGEKNG